MVKENIVVVCTIVLCFMLTLSLCMIFSGDGLVWVFNDKVKSENVYAIAIGGYNDITLARQSADLIKKRGGAGYVIVGEDKNIEILYAVYKSENDAKSVLEKLDEKSAYVKTIAIDEGNFSWCKKELKECVKDALKYYDIAFDVMYSTANKLNSKEMSIDDAKTQIKVLYSQIEDIKSVFYKNVEECNDDEITQIKLALVTTLALLDGIQFNSSSANILGDIRYQLVQLVLCRQALMSRL